MVHTVKKKVPVQKDKTPFEMAVDQLIDLRGWGKDGGGTGGDNAVYGGISKVDADYFEYPCHAHMKDLHKETEVVWSKFVLPVTRPYKTAGKEYFDWITSDSSPWKLAFDMGMSFSDKKIFNRTFWFDKGFIFDRLDVVPSNVMHNFLVASRMPKEWPTKILRWHDYYKQGLSPEMAMIMVSLFNDGSEDEDYDYDDEENLPTEIKRLRRRPMYQNHYDWPLDVVTGTEEMAKRFLSHNMDKKVFNIPYMKSHNYTPVNRIWGRSPIDASDPTYSRSNTKENRRNCYGVVNLFEPDNLGTIAGLYSKNIGVIEERPQTFGKPPLEWKCNRDEIVEIGKQEQKRLAA